MHTDRKDLICKLLKGIETGDPESVTVVNEDKYIQHNPQTHEGSEGLAALFKRLAETNPHVNIVRIFEDDDFEDDDEELDEYKNVDENSYTNNQIEQFREVLYTLKTEEIRYWLLSIERRHIQLPAILKSEARMLMAEA